MKLSVLLATILFPTAVFAGGNTTTAVPNTGTTNVAGFVCFTSQFCTSHVNINNAGVEVGTATTPFRIDPTGTTTQPVSGTVAVSGTVTTTTGGVAQGSTTSGQLGTLIQAAVTTGVPNYTTGQTNPLSIDPVTAGVRIVAPTSQLLTSGATAPGVDPGMGIAVLCQNGGSPTVSAAQTVAIQCGPNGALQTSAGTIAPATAVGTVAGMPLFGVYLATPPTAAASTWNGLTTDVNRNLNVNVAAGAAANSAASATGSAVPLNAGYTGLNVGGNNTGWTGTSVGAVRAGDINLDLVNGAAVAVGNGTAATAIRVAPASDSTTQVAINQGTPGTSNGISPVLTATGGWTPKLLNGLGATAVAVKASGGQMGLLYCYNPNSTVAYIQVFNTAAAGVTVGTTTPVQSYGIPPTQNAGFPLAFPGIQFSTAISVAATTAATNGVGPGIPMDCDAGFN